MESFTPHWVRAVLHILGKILWRQKHCWEAPAPSHNDAAHLEQFHFLNRPLLTILRIPAQLRTQGALIEPVFALIGTVLALQTGIYYGGRFDPPARWNTPPLASHCEQCRGQIETKGCEWNGQFFHVFRKWYSRTFLLLKASTVQA